MISIFVQGTMMREMVSEGLVDFLTKACWICKSREVFEPLYCAKWNPFVQDEKSYSTIPKVFLYQWQNIVIYQFQMAMVELLHQVWTLSGALLGRVDPSLMNSVTGSGFVAQYINMLSDPSFVNTVTGSGFVAKCSNILQNI
jgi:hypothetical protein